MGEIAHNKLVRDKIPAIIEADGHTPVFRILEDEEKPAAAFDKVCEEAAELRDSRGALGEFADVYTSLEAAAQVSGYTMDQVKLAAEEKAALRGGFNNWVFLEKVIENEHRD